MSIFKKTVFITVVGLGVLATATFADSHADKNMEPAVQARHAQMQMVGYHIGILGGVAKGEIPFDAMMVNAAAKNIAQLAAMDQATLWVEGTAQGTSAGSRATEKVWSDAAGFKAKFSDMETAALALIGAADAGAVGAGMGALGGSCKGCHQTYRGPKN